MLQGEGYDAIRSRLFSYDKVFIGAYRQFCSILGSLYRTHAGIIGASSFAGLSYLNSDDIYSDIRSIDREINNWYQQAEKMQCHTFSSLYSLEGTKAELLLRIEELETYGREIAPHYDEAVILADCLRRGARQTGSLIWQDGSWVATNNAGDLSWHQDFKTASGLAQQRLLELARKYVYKETEGRYGGFQSNPRSFFNRGIFGNSSQRDELINLVLSQYPDLAGLTEAQIDFLLAEVQRAGCGYTAVANAIIERYYFRPEEFERDFGFPLFRDDGNTINFEYLIVDLFCAKAQYDIDNGTVSGPGIYDGIRPSYDVAFINNYLEENTGGRVNVDISVMPYDPAANYAALMKDAALALYNPGAPAQMMYTPVTPSITLTATPVNYAHISVITHVDYDANGDLVLDISSWGNAYHPQNFYDPNRAYYDINTNTFMSEAALQNLPPGTSITVIDCRAKVDVINWIE